MSTRRMPKPRLSRVPILKFFSIIVLLVMSVPVATDISASTAKPLQILEF
jgi:hypothetical protein